MTPEESKRRRLEMVHRQIECRGIRDSRVLEVLREIPRENFVPPEFRDQAYTDGPLAIGRGQTISQPYIVALMTEAMELRSDQVALEIGTGSGYQAAILAKLCRWVYTLERLPELSRSAAERVEKLGLANLTFLVGDGTLGFPAEAPYDAIMVTAGAPDVPQALLSQLADGGRLVIPVGDRNRQMLLQIRKKGTEYIHKELCACVFVPLLGEQGWREEKP